MTDFMNLAFANPLSINTQVAGRTSRTRDGSVVGTNEGYPRWQVDIGLEPQKFDSFRPQLMSHRIKHGSLVPFTVKMPQVVSIVDLPDDAKYTMKANAVRGDREVTVLSDGTYRLVVGRFVSFDNHAKVYQVEAIRQSGTNQIVTFTHDLIVDIAVNRKMILNPKLTCTYTEGSGGHYEMNRNSIITSSISLLES